MHAEALRYRWVALVLWGALITTGCTTLAPRPGPEGIVGPRAAPALRDTLSDASPPQSSSSAASPEPTTQGPLRRRHSERRRGTDVALVNPEEMALRQAASAMPPAPGPSTPEGSAVPEGWSGLPWTDDTGYVTGPDGKKRERGSGWSLGDANRVTASELMAMSPEERRAFWQQAAPGLPMPGSLESAELADRFSDQFNQGMVDILQTVSMAAGANLATLPPVTKVPQIVAKGVAAESAAGRGASGVIDLLRPGGRLIGDAGTNSRIRLLKGGQAEAEALFGKLSKGGEIVEGTTYPGTLVRLPGGGRVGLRPMSTSGPPTIDIVIEGLGIREIKFLP